MRALWVNGDSGDDGNSGLSEALAKKTLEQVRSAATFYAGQDQDTVLVNCRGRFQRTSSALALNASAPDGHLIRFVRDTEFALYSGDLVTGWVRDASGLFWADVGTGLDFRHITIGGRLGYIARWSQPFHILGIDAANRTVEVNAEAVQFFPEGHKGEFWIIPDGWAVTGLRVDSFTAPSGGRVTVTFKEPERTAWFIRSAAGGIGPYRSVGQTFYCQNAAAFLDAAVPYRFWYDAANGILWTSAPEEVTALPQGEQAAALEALGVRIPNLSTLLTFGGAGLRVEECDLTGTDWNGPNSHGFVGFNPGVYCTLSETTEAALARMVGQWSSSVSYATDDLVIYQRKVWNCIQAGSGHTPPDNTESDEWWELFDAAPLVQNRMPGAVESTAAENCATWRCRFHDIGADAHLMNYGCKGTTDLEPFYQRVAGSGFKADQTANTLERASEEQRLEGIVLSDGYFREVGEEYGGCAAWLAGVHTGEMKHLDADQIGGYGFMLAIGSRLDGPSTMLRLSCHHFKARRVMTRVVDGGAAYGAGLVGTDAVLAQQPAGFAGPRAWFRHFDIADMPPPEPVNWRGVYDPAGTYAVGDGVLYFGPTFSAYFICTAPTTGNAPASVSDYWKINEGFRAGGYADLGFQGAFWGPGKIEGVDVPIKMNSTRFNDYADIQITDPLSFEQHSSFSGVIRIQYDADDDTYTNTIYATPYAVDQVEKWEGGTVGGTSYPAWKELFPFESLAAVFVDGEGPPFNHLSAMRNVGEGARVMMRGVGPRRPAREYWQGRGVLD